MTQKQKTITIGGVLLALVIAGGGAYFGYQQMHKTSVLGSQQEVVTLIKAVGKLIDLPQETPTIATVSDATKLRSQSFFLHAQNGDKVLIFAQAKEAILYRPSANKIVTVAPVNIQSTPTPTVAQAAPATAAATATVTPTAAVTLTPTRGVFKATPTAVVTKTLLSPTPTVTRTP